MVPSARTAPILVAAFALLATSVAAAPASASAPTLPLSASASIVVSGDAVTMSGTLVDTTSCVAGRAVALSWRAADAPAFAPAGEGTTASDGSFSFTVAEPYTGRFQAAVAATGSCAAAVSAELLVRVRARVDASVVAGSLAAGSCLRVAATVSPPKPSQTVELQRHGSGGWTPVQTMTLDQASTTSARPCFGWSEIGLVRLRVRWSPQDDLNEAGDSVTLGFRIVEAPWMHRIDGLVGGRSMSVSIGRQGAPLYGRSPQAPRTPASNEKLLLSMALLDRFGPGATIPTSAAARSRPRHGVLRGNLWILGEGDPQVGRASIGALARQVRAAGIRRIVGRVIGSTGSFARDWDAPGWNQVARESVSRPTALTFEGNGSSDPERAAAASLTEQLERLGVRIAGRAGSGAPPVDLRTVAAIHSHPLRAILAKMLRPSDNFFAEVLGKGLGAAVSGAPGTIAKGAAAISAWTADHGAPFRLFDSSGLSYDDRVTADGIVHLLSESETAPWGDDLRRALASGGQGTLRVRLDRVKVRAKTGTLEDISALSGWVWSTRLSTWVEFSILSSGLSKTAASRIEDEIVRIVSRAAR